MARPRNAFIGRWRITSIEGWEQPDIELLGPAHIEFDARNGGKFRFAAVSGEIDYRLSVKGVDAVVEWCWVGDDDGTETSGRGRARRDNQNIHGQIFIFGGDDFSLPSRPSEG